MTQPAGGEVGVEQIHVPHEYRVQQRCLIRTRASASDECAHRVPTDGTDLLAHRGDHLAVECGQGASNAVEDVARQGGAGVA